MSTFGQTSATTTATATLVPKTTATSSNTGFQFKVGDTKSETSVTPAVSSTFTFGKQTTLSSSESSSGNKANLFQFTASTESTAKSTCKHQVITFNVYFSFIQFSAAGFTFGTNPSLNNSNATKSEQPFQFNSQATSSFPTGKGFTSSNFGTSKAPGFVDSAKSTNTSGIIEFFFW